MKQLKLSDLKAFEIINVYFNGVYYDKFYEYHKYYYAIITEHEFNKGRSSRVYFLIGKVLKNNIYYYLAVDYNKINMDYISLKEYGNFYYYHLYEDDIEFVTESVDDVNKYLLLE